MYVKPAKGLQVPDPELRDYLPKEGREVSPSEYWTRRLLDGDVKETEAPREPKAKPEAAAPQRAADAPVLPKE
jgi:hypothetical protein